MSALPWRPRRLTLLAQITLTATHRKHRTNKGSVCLPVPGTHTSSFSWATEGWRRVGRANRPTENGESEVAEEEQEQGTKGEETHRRTDGRTDGRTRTAGGRTTRGYAHVLGLWLWHVGARGSVLVLSLAPRSLPPPPSPRAQHSPRTDRPTDRHRNGDHARRAPHAHVAHAHVALSSFLHLTTRVKPVTVAPLSCSCYSSVCYQTGCSHQNQYA